MELGHKEGEAAVPTSQEWCLSVAHSVHVDTGIESVSVNGDMEIGFAVLPQHFRIMKFSGQQHLCIKIFAVE